MATPGSGAAPEAGPPFGCIESAHEYVGLLLQALEEAANDVGEQLHRPPSPAAARRLEAFQIVAYKLEQLRVHLATSRRLLNDLRTLRRVLLGERSVTPVSGPLATEREEAAA
jgi:hypothetical protein